MRYFIKTPLVTIEQDFYDRKAYLEDVHLRWGYRSYSDYNYLMPGIISYIKIMHFELALKLTQEYFHKCNVIDFGCADGPLLRSLSKYFNYVVGIDINRKFIKIASKLCEELYLSNVELICNEGLKIGDVKSKIQDKKFGIIYFLEGVEHIGNKEKFYESKIIFLKEISTLIDEEGIIVISVPKMVGVPFLIQRMGLELFGLHKEPIAMADLLKASLYGDTKNLEKKWNGGHLGFNHERLEKYLQEDFCIVKRKDIFFQIVYVIKKLKNESVIDQCTVC